MKLSQLHANVKKAWITPDARLVPINYASHNDSLQHGDIIWDVIGPYLGVSKIWANKEGDGFDLEPAMLKVLRNDFPDLPTVAGLDELRNDLEGRFDEGDLKRSLFKAVFSVGFCRLNIVNGVAYIETIPGMHQHALKLLTKTSDQLSPWQELVVDVGKTTVCWDKNRWSRCQ